LGNLIYWKLEDTRDQARFKGMIIGFW